MKWNDITSGRSLTMTVPVRQETLLERQARERADLKAQLDGTRQARAWNAATTEYLETSPTVARDKAN